jgi:hypothetical protein
VNDDIDQLLKNLKFRRMREILDDELARAEKRKPSYSEFLARVLREEYQHQQERFLEYRIDRANIPVSASRRRVALLVERAQAWLHDEGIGVGAASGCLEGEWFGRARVLSRA